VTSVGMPVVVAFHGDICGVCALRHLSFTVDKTTPAFCELVTFTWSTESCRLVCLAGSSTITIPGFRPYILDAHGNCGHRREDDYDHDGDAVGIVDGPTLKEMWGRLSACPTNS
jgi:hypothetical protein